MDLELEDAWDLYEAAFWCILNNFIPSEGPTWFDRGYIIKKEDLIKRITTDCPSLFGDVGDIIKIYDRSIRAIGAGKLKAKIVEQKEYVIPKDYIEWAEKNFIRSNNKCLSKEAINNGS